MNSVNEISENLLLIVKKGEPTLEGQRLLAEVSSEWEMGSGK